MSDSVSKDLEVTRVSDGMSIVYVDDVGAFNVLCADWQKEKFLAIDTEFERTSTFYARIGLMQVADSKSCYLIDPLAIDDWSAFKAVINNPECTLVMHSCSEDLNLLQTFMGCLPCSLFDTQLAAAFLGIGFSISYQGLVEAMLGIAVDKEETRSDWIKRQLSEKQIRYAATDVRYLLQIRDLLSEQLEQRKMLSWLDAECNQQLAIAGLIEDVSQWQAYYTGLSNAWKLDQVGLQALQLLCVWREEKARVRNKPRSWIVKDNELLGLCHGVSSDLSQGPLSMEMLANIEGLDSRFISRYGRELVELLSDSTNRQEVDAALLNKPLNAVLRKKLKQCKQAANSKAEALGMAPELLGRKKFLLELLREFDRTGELHWSGELSGWRKELLEPELAAIIVKN